MTNLKRGYIRFIEATILDAPEPLGRNMALVEFRGANLRTGCEEYQRVRVFPNQLQERRDICQGFALAKAINYDPDVLAWVIEELEDEYMHLDDDCGDRDFVERIAAFLDTLRNIRDTR
jgi:hypothetical protein